MGVADHWVGWRATWLGKGDGKVHQREAPPSLPPVILGRGGEICTTSCCQITSVPVSRGGAENVLRVLLGESEMFSYNYCLRPFVPFFCLLLFHLPTFGPNMDFKSYCRNWLLHESVLVLWIRKCLLVSLTPRSLWLQGSSILPAFIRVGSDMSVYGKSS